VTLVGKQLAGGVAGWCASEDLEHRGVKWSE